MNYEKLLFRSTVTIVQTLCDYATIVEIEQTYDYA